MNNIVYVVGKGVEGAVTSGKGEIYQLDKQNDTFTGKYIGYSSIKELFGVCKDTNDNIYVTGTSKNPTSGGDNDILKLKYDSNLNLIKAATYGDSLRNYGWKIKQLSNGNLAVCGYIYDTSTYKYKGVLLVIDTDLNGLSDKSASLDLGVDEVTSASSIKTSDVGTNVDELYDETSDAIEETEDLINAIRDSDTWDDITNKTELDTLLDSAESSIDTIKLSAEEEYNETNNALVVVVESLYALDDDLSQIGDMLDSVGNTRTQLIDSISNIKSKITILLSDLTLAKDKSLLIYLK